MRVIIEVHSGPLQGRRFLVRDRQVMSFGRTEEADVAVTVDDQMSGIHFDVTNVANRCTVRDAGSTNGTQVNGEFIIEADLHSRDLIVAGGTEFHVSMEGMVGGVEAATPQRNSVVVDKSRVATDPSLASQSFRVESCGSGLRLISGAMIGDLQEPFAISTITSPLAKHLPQFLIVDFRKAEIPVPAELGDMVPLFDWIPAELAASNSPLIIPPTAALDSGELVDQAWDKDAVVVIYSDLEPESLVQHLRAATRMNLDGSVPDRENSQGMLGYCWPSVLAPLLAFQTAEFVDAFLAGIDAVLIEMPDLPGTWQIYSRNGFPDVLASMGFRQFPDEEPPREVVTPFNV